MRFVCLLTGLAFCPLVGCGGSETVQAVPPVVPSHPSPVVSSNAAVTVVAPAPEDVTLGQLTFTVTGNPGCQRSFRQGMLALHSFLYDQAHESFGKALELDPHCAMAAWGDAMAYNHAIWSERDVAKGRASLLRVTGEETLSAKERAYLTVARSMFSKESRNDAHVDWVAGTANMLRDYPDDDEVVLQHALALISVYGYDPMHLREQMEAGSLALGVFARRPGHPGAAHYAIHAFDNPEHAILALPAARTYARIAPAAFHAQHMPSHIFVQLGMWQEVVPSNERAYAASVAWETAHGHSPSKYDWHSYSWLVAAHLELGQPAEARKLIDEARLLLVAAKDDSGSLRGGYIDMISDYLSQTQRWDDTEALVAPLFAPALDEGSDGAHPVACAAHAPGGSGGARPPVVLWARLSAQALRAESAIRSGDEGVLALRLADMKTIRTQMAPWARTEPPSTNADLETFEETLRARTKAAAHSSPATIKRAVSALERLAAIENAHPSGSPAFEPPADERIAEVLLATGNAKDALAYFDKDLQARPSRALALLGAARAAKALGDTDQSHHYYVALAHQWQDADASLPALAEVRAGTK